MVAVSKIVFVATAAAGVMAAPASQQAGPLVQFNEVKQLPASWASVGQANRDTMVKAQIGLKQNNIKGLQAKLMDISNPESPNYGKWLSKEQVDEYTAPAAADVAAVKAWLAANGITEVSMPSNDWIEFSVPIHQMESLLAAKYELYQHATTGAKVPRTKQYSVPQNLHSVIDVVTPTTAFVSKIAPHIHENSAKGAAAGGLTSPASIKSAYNVDYTPSGNGQLIASTGFIGIGASHQDYAAFGRQFVSGLKDFKDVGVNGGSNSGDGSQLEGNLDTQYMGGVGHPLQSEYLAVAPTGSDDKSFNDAMLALTSYLNTNANPPSVVSTSYGAEERTLDGSYLDRICNEFMKAGSRGVSVFFSSGDNGNGGNGGNNCNNGYYGTWPASCPYVTTVGGTEFDSNNNEVVANFAQYTNGKITSPGGGYSEHFTAPDYNKNVTQAYAKTLPSAMQQRLNANNRGYPDISLVSVKYQTNVNGQIAQVLGTSASSPAIAALFGALNDYRKSKGQANLGFINPLLYSSKTRNALRDVTSGRNPGCDSVGFPAQSGWDAASGLGSFDFAKFRTLI
ncbi:hypothetical protein VHEMI10160 [[Torrubiella] hemipterigena]|uniref:tripeptidyl-peptidase II n=1 Tax=[Torrubiella] hemipterigena TaxID=1531966 RepID=A0A0A1TC59_9HYPO|nr:hypothetical protein VHEMI10160 [[Torrubiella] hemipterigena]